MATIVLDASRFSSDALAGLVEFSHLEVVYLFDRVDLAAVEIGARHPRGNPAWPQVGIFAQRAKGRPNRIGVSTCRLVAVEGLSVTVEALDAIDGTPVLDIKPYMTEFAPRGEVRQPAWSHQLMAGYWTAADGVAQRAEGADVVRRSYDTVADRYAAEVGDELAAKPLDRALLDVFALTSAGGTVADLGAGPGHVGSYLAARDVRVVALDLSPVMCGLARSRTGLPAAAGDLRALPLASGSLSGALCWYALIHLDAPGRADAYREIARVTRPGSHVLVAFHTSDAETPPGGAKVLTEWWDRPVALTVRFLDPAAETQTARAAGLELVARLDRQPHPGSEHPSQRSYLLLRTTPR